MIQNKTKTEWDVSVGDLVRADFANWNQKKYLGICLGISTEDPLGEKYEVYTIYWFTPKVFSGVGIYYRDQLRKVKKSSNAKT